MITFPFSIPHSRYNKRHVALKLAYLGWDYSGLAIQDTVENTIEVRADSILDLESSFQVSLEWDHTSKCLRIPFPYQARLFECLQKTKLVEDLQNCNYSRCGRTDKGVSALGQVIPLPTVTQSKTFGHHSSNFGYGLELS